MSAPYVDHLLSRLTADLDFLESQHLLTRPDKESILAKLPSPSNSSSNSLDGHMSSLSLNSTSASTAATARSVPARPAPSQPKQQARANWTYNSGDPQDLAFQEGDVIEIVDEENADWWKGRMGGREGLLPANYVTKIAPTAARSPNPPAYTPGAGRTILAPPPNEPKQAYYTPTGPPPWQSQPSQSYQPPSQAYQPPAQQYQPPVQQYQPPPQPMQDQPKPSRFGNLGNTMANAAAGGLGFGAGAAIGGDLVNAIF
ncbi:hypothetical protein CALVIDRAFT_568175 [Calocera viscosa TUFC12733]|uniref:SH3 domain-containing protein n=1 Tax=Calocera viscosa (strain TUFC12733) TaxID=1330018 RepID=A0A167HCK7_CALVF|nr:hypothetical protein CALVIDRAFT_568175 [Calocera viscosa TUFC12733]